MLFGRGDTQREAEVFESRKAVESRCDGSSGSQTVADGLTPAARQLGTPVHRAVMVTWLRFRAERRLKAEVRFVDKRCQGAMSSAKWAAKLMAYSSPSLESRVSRARDPAKASAPSSVTSLFLCHKSPQQDQPS